MRASGCLRGAPLVLWERGILARLPGCLNQPIVGAAPERRGCALLMRDVTPVAGARHRRADPAGPARAVPAAHGRPARGVLGLRGASSTSSRPCTATWSSRRGWRRRRPPRARRTWCRGWSAKGWPLLAEVAPAAAAVVTPLAHDPGPLLEALAGTPQTFVHSNFKLDNLGTDDAGRTVLLDWEQPGRGAPLSATWPGTWPSTAAACRSPRRPRSRPTGRRWRPAASTPGPGGTASWRCACSAPWSCSAGRRRSAATTRSSRGGRRSPWRRRPC